MDQIVNILLRIEMFVGGCVGFILDNTVPGKLFTVITICCLTIKLFTVITICCLTILMLNLSLCPGSPNCESLLKESLMTGADAHPDKTPTNTAISPTSQVLDKRGFVPCAGDLKLILRRDRMRHLSALGQLLQYPWHHSTSGATRAERGLQDFTKSDVVRSRTYEFPATIINFEKKITFLNYIPFLPNFQENDTLSMREKNCSKC